MDKKTNEFISKQTGNPILEWRICKWSGEEFPIFQLQRDIEKSMHVTYQQDLSPSAMFRSICMYRNERRLYKNTSKKSGKPLISMCAVESGAPVDDPTEFWSEDFILPGKDIPQNLDDVVTSYAALVKRVPKIARLTDKNENADFANYVSNSKNVYMSFLVYYESEDVYYSYYIIPGRDIVDCFYVKKADLCYEGINIFDSYSIFYGYNINNSQNCYFSTDLDNCHYCLFCNNLRGKSYYIHNKEYSKEEFDAYFEQMKKNMKTYSGLQKYIHEYNQVLDSAIYKTVNHISSENCIGDALVNCHNSIFVFDSRESNESVNVWGGPFEKCLNIIGGYASYVVNSGRIGAGIVGESSSKIMGCYNSYSSHNVINCQDMIGCNNMLFCCGLKNKEYCILNKQLTKEEREQISSNIINQMNMAGTYGAPPAHELSPFPYNDTIANDFFPVKSVVMGDTTMVVNPDGEGVVTVSQPEKFISPAILDLGGKEKIHITRRTRDTEINIPENAKKIAASNLPDNIEDVQDDILSQIIICEVSGRPFRIVGPELTFYRKHGLPLPRRHHDVRHQARRDKRPSRNLYLRACDNCSIEMLSVYGPRVTHKVYCEQCYNKELYG